MVARVDRGMIHLADRSGRAPQMSATPDNTLADPERLIADLRRWLAECRAQRDEALAQQTPARQGIAGHQFVATRSRAALPV